MRTGFGGQKVVMNGGALVLPIVHEVIPVNMNTLRLEVKRGRDSALITRDRMRVDVVAEFYVRVQPTLDAIASAAQTLGQRTMQPNRCASCWKQVRRCTALRRGGNEHGRVTRKTRRVRQTSARSGERRLAEEWPGA